MPLTVNTELCPIDGELTGNDRYAIGIAMQFAGMSTITRENFVEVCNRITFVEKLFGPIRWARKAGSDPSEDVGMDELVGVRYSPEELQGYLWLRTNGVYVSSAKWRKRLWDGHVEELSRHLLKLTWPK